MDIEKEAYQIQSIAMDLSDSLRLIFDEVGLLDNFIDFQFEGLQLQAHMSKFLAAFSILTWILV